MEKFKITMAWFTETTINNQMAVNEVRILAGTVLIMAIIVTLYLALRVWNKYQKKGTQNQVQREIQLNNIRSA